MCIRDSVSGLTRNLYQCLIDFDIPLYLNHAVTFIHGQDRVCLLYTSDAADDLLCVDLGGRRIIKKKNEHQQAANIRRYVTYTHTEHSPYIYVSYTTRLNHSAQ